LRFDSVLIVLLSLVGPQGLADIRPFLATVLRGRRVSPERVEEVARHYKLFGGVSSITEITRRQANGLRDRLAAAGLPLPVYVGIRNRHPLLPETLREMHDAGAPRHLVEPIEVASNNSVVANLPVAIAVGNRHVERFLVDIQPHEQCCSSL
jgi:protoheme ferro-lyase